MRMLARSFAALLRRERT
jgi:hypothetical protein